MASKRKPTEPTEPAVAEQPPQPKPEPPPSTVPLDPIWRKRLDTMASLVGASPQKYLETLLARAWSAVPLGKRGLQ